jgi:hypothetical protein
MVRHRLAAHVQVSAQLAQWLTVVGVELIEQLPATPTGERLERLVHAGVGLGASARHMVQTRAHTDEDSG